MSNPAQTRNIRYVSGVTQYVVKGTDDIINIDTSVNAVTVILPNIKSSGLFAEPKIFTINDISNNAAVNNITIVGTNGDTVNSSSSLVVVVNGANAKCAVANTTEWLVVGVGVVAPSTQTLAQTLVIGKWSAGNNVGISSGDKVEFARGSGGLLDTETTTAARTWELPDQSGVIALLSDIFPSTPVTYLDPVISQINTPPGAPTTGDRYLINTAPTGVWIGNANSVAEWDGLAWVYTVPVLDNVVYITSTLTTKRFNGTAWVAYAGSAILQNGNAFGSPMIIGTNDNQLVYVKVNGANEVRFGNATNTFKRATLIGATSAGNIGAASAILELRSTSTGFLAPRMTSAQRLLISSPATSLLVYQTDGTAGFYYYTGAVWTMLDANASDWNLNGNTVGSVQTIGTIDAFDFPIITTNIERVRVTAAGRVAIGLTSPVAKLDVKGETSDSTAYTFLLQNNSGLSLFETRNDGYTIFNQQQGIDADFVIKSSSSANLFVADSGTNRIGIGIGSPIARLDVRGTTSDSSAYVLELASAAGLSMLEMRNDGYTIFNIQQHVDADFVLRSNTSLNLFVADSGLNSIGVGTSSPTGKLHIVGNSTSDGLNTFVTQDASSNNILVVRDSRKVTINGGAGYGETFGITQRPILSAADYMIMAVVNAGGSGVRFAVQDDGAGVGGNTYTGLGGATCFPLANANYSSFQLNSYSASNIYQLFSNRGGAAVGSIAMGHIGFIGDTNRAFILDQEISGNMRLYMTNTAGGTSFLLQGDSAAQTIAGISTQQLGVGTGSPNASAKMQIDSTTMGFAPPRMTTAERTAIGGGTPGVPIIVFDTDLSQYYGWNGTLWAILG